eukprot:gene63603-87003_t
MVGHAGHPEVVGTLGRFDTSHGGAAHLVETLDGVKALQVRDPSRVAVVTQTTLSVDDTADIAAALTANQPVVNPGLRRLTNPGNVGLCLQQNVMRPVGMDAYAGAAEFRSLDKAGQPDRGWSGYRLKDDQRGWRQRFCEEVAADIETMLGPRNRKILFAATNRLPKNAGQRLATGMDQGIAKLKATLRTIGDPRRAPPGLIGRMVAL